MLGNDGTMALHSKRPERFRDKKSFRDEDCVLEFVKAEKLEKSN